VNDSVNEWCPSVGIGTVFFEISLIGHFCLELIFVGLFDGTTAANHKWKPVMSSPILKSREGFRQTPDISLLPPRGIDLLFHKKLENLCLNSMP
jgi:hypothetical protein